MTKFTIEDSSDIQRREPYPFKKLKVGQSFTVDRQHERSMRTQASKHHAKSKKRFTVARTEDDKGNEVVTVKRLK